MAGNEFTYCAWSAVYFLRTSINTLISCCKECGRGAMGARGGGAWLGTRAQLRIQTCWSARLGVSVVILARGEGVNVCCAPPPPSRIAHCLPKARVKLCKGRYIQRIYTLCNRSARDGLFDGDCSLGGGGWCACVPLPLVGSLVVCQNARKKTPAGSSDTPNLPHALVPPSPRTKLKNMTET